MYAARVLADSFCRDADNGYRLTTVQATFPRFILAEVNTHRRLSRNSASSRAIPPELQIAKVRETPFVPEVFRSRVKGMGQGEELEDQEGLRATWILAAMHSADIAEELMDSNLSKALVNRVMEPYLWHTAILSATEWENFFALRCPPGEEVDPTFPAQPEFQQIAILMRRAMSESYPERLGMDEWHLPLVRVDERNDQLACEISAGRCATISYEKQEAEWEDATLSIERCQKLCVSGHMSPLEHQARPMMPGEEDLGGNFDGWTQFRKLIPHEENRVGFLEKRSVDW